MATLPLPPPDLTISADTAESYSVLRPTWQVRFGRYEPPSVSDEMLPKYVLSGDSFWKPFLPSPLKDECEVEFEEEAWCEPGYEDEAAYEAEAGYDTGFESDGYYYEDWEGYESNEEGEP